MRSPNLLRGVLMYGPLICTGYIIKGHIGEVPFLRAHTKGLCNYPKIIPSLSLALSRYHLLKNPKNTKDSVPYIALIRKNICHLCFCGGEFLGK